MRKEKIKDNKLILYIILVAFAIIIVPHLLRYLSGNPAIMGEEAYLHGRIAERIVDGDYTIDNLVVDGRTLYYSPYHFLLAVIATITSITVASIILPLALGIGSALMFYFLLKKFNMDSVEGFAALFVLIISPAFVYTFSISTNHSLSLFLILFSAWAYMKKGTLQKIAFLSFTVASIINMFNGFILLLLLIMIIIKKKKNQKHIFFTIMILALIAFFIQPPLTSIYQQTTNNIMTETISDLGAHIGFGVFMIILCAFGMIWSWCNKKEVYPLYIIPIFIFIAANFTGAETLIYAAPIISVFCAMGIRKIKDFEWELEPLKHLTILVIICGLLFSSISYIAELPNFNPNVDVIDALDTLKEKYDGGIAISHHSNGYYIENAGIKVLIDSHMNSIKNINEKIMDTHTLFFTRDLEEAKEIFEKYDIKYIVIDERMKQGLVWEEDEQGLLFLFRNTETFKKLQTPQKIDIYEIQR